LNTPRIGIGMIENRKGVESLGGEGLGMGGESSWKFLGKFLESSWKVLGKFLDFSGVRVWVVVS
jgi:hypothetical protein